jgi:hypothetical protein
MHKICILGNSHVASLKQGWKNTMGDWPGIEVSFFAQAGNEGLKSVFADGQHLTSNNSKARDSFVLTHGEGHMDIDKYDSFLIYGAGSVNYWPGNIFYSTNCVKSVVDDLTCNTPAQHVLSCLRKVSKAPIFIGHTPLHAAKKIRDRNVSDEYLDGIETLNRLHYGQYNAEMVSQPLKTIVNSRNTAPEYSWGVQTLASVIGGRDEKSGSTDNTHMDGTFGEIWLNEFFSKRLSSFSKT